MSKKIVIRLFFISSCGGGCSCGPNKDVAALELAAEKLVKKFGMDNLDFEAYPTIDFNKFPYLRKAAGPAGKITLPLVSIGETLLTPGSFPPYLELEKEVAKRLEAI